jgi:MFS family permease
MSVADIPPDSAPAPVPVRRHWADPRSWPFAAAALATFADYFGLSLMVPSLPFYLTDLGLANVDEVALWNGAIGTSQFIAVVFGNVLWGIVGDRLGSKRALQLAMAGDTLFYALTAVVRAPPLLLVVRFGCGLSTPLTPALLYIFERATSPAAAVKGVSRYAISIMCAYCVGGVVVAFAYNGIGWLGINLVSASVCGGTLAFITLLSAPSPHAGPRPKPEGIRRAITSAAFLNHGVTAFCQGSAFQSFFLLVVLLMKDNFALTTRETGFVFVTVPVMLFVLQVLITRWVKAVGYNFVITVGALISIPFTAALCVPATLTSLPAVFVLSAAQCCAMLCQMLPNQSKAKAIATAYATNAVGAVTGLGRVCFALGQGTAPIISSSLYTLSPAYSYGYWLVLQCVQLCINLASRQPLFHDPPIGRDVVPL